MADLLPPVLTKPLAPIIANEGAVFGPLDLSLLITSPNEESGDVQFGAERLDGQDLPKGVTCSLDGLFGGIPANGTTGIYQISIIAGNKSEKPLLVPFTLTIQPRPVAEDPNYLANVKKQVWEALGKNQPIPNVTDIVERPVTAVEIYYLLQRYASLAIWDVYNLEPAGDKIALNLPGTSPHYQIYDRGSCLVGAPKDLFSHQRTLADAIQTSKVMAQEVAKRGWTIEFAGFNKMVRAAWIELQAIGNKTGKFTEILHYTPSLEDARLYQREGMGTGPSIGKQT